jgi:hypothetical protein
MKLNWSTLPCTILQLAVMLGAVWIGKYSDGLAVLIVMANTAFLMWRFYVFTLPVCVYEKETTMLWKIWDRYCWNPKNPKWAFAVACLLLASPFDPLPEGVLGPFGIPDDLLYALVAARSAFLALLQTSAALRQKFGTLIKRPDANVIDAEFEIKG